MGPGDSGEFSVKFLGEGSLVSPAVWSFLSVTLGGRPVGHHFPVSIGLIQRFLSIPHSMIPQEKAQE